MKIMISALLLCTASSAMALGEAIEIYRQNHPNQTSSNSTNTTVIYSDDSDSSGNTVIYAPNGVNRAVVNPVGNNSLNNRHTKARAIQNDNNFQPQRNMNREGGRMHHR